MFVASSSITKASFASVSIATAALCASSAVASSPDVSFYLHSNNENTDILSVGTGLFRPGNVSDLIYIDGDNDIKLRQSTGSGRSLESSVLVSTAEDYRKLWVVDVNGDGFDDIVAISNANDFYVLLASGDQSPSFGSPLTFSLSLAQSAEGDGVATSIDDMDLGDFNGDGKVDLAIVASVMSSKLSGGDDPDDPPETTYYDQAYFGVALNQGGGNFSTPGLNPTGATSSGSDAFIFTAAFMGRVTAGDFNGDGRLDAGFCYHTDKSITPPAAKIFAGNGDGTLNSSSATGTGHSDCQDVSAILPSGPFENVISSNQQATFLFIGNNEDYAQVYASDWTLTSETDMKKTPRGPVGPFNDFDVDGSADMVYTDGNSSLVMVGWDWSDTSGGKINDYSYSMTLGTDTQTSDVGDLDGDGMPDVVGGYEQGVNVYYNTTAN